jgi:CHAD domain-containing protein
VEAGVRRIAADRIDDALAAIDDVNLDRDKAVHTVRKRCKELRALVRLVAPSLRRNAKGEDRAIRGIARSLCGQRDAAVMAATFERIAAEDAARLDPAVVDTVRHALANAKAPYADPARALDGVRDPLLAARGRATAWRLDEKGWKALSDGLERTFRSARKAMKPALKSGDDEELHEWRKDVKAHAYHLRILRPLWPEVLKPASAAADRLGEALGEHHDLAVLATRIEADADRLGWQDSVVPLVAICRERQDGLEREAASLGARLFAEKPGAIADRLGGYWTAWRRETRQLREAARERGVPAGALAA